MKKRGKKLLALTLALAMVCASTASVFAAADPGKVITTDWPIFRGGSDNNGVTAAKTPDTGGGRYAVLGLQERKRMVHRARALRSWWTDICILIQAKR